MTLDDRLTRGFFAGILGGFPTLVWGLVSKYILRFTTLLYADFASVLMMGHKPDGIGEQLFSHFAVFMFYGLLGTVFAYMIKHVSSRNLAFKGILWGGIVWFASYAITLLYKVPEFTTIPLRTSISQLMGSALWGYVTALSFAYLDKLNQERI